MSTLFVRNDEAVDALLARRRELGLDGHDEVWEGVYHVAPHEHVGNADIAAQLLVRLGPLALRRGLTPTTAFNLGRRDDYRVPDLGIHRGRPQGLYCASAAAVVEVRSPHDETFAKFAFYAAQGVAEVWVVDPADHSVRIWQLQGAAYAETGVSDLLGTEADAVSSLLSWPPD